MVGKDGHLVIGAKHAEGINQQAAHRLFNSMNCLLLAEKKPATLAMLEEAYLEMEGSSVPHHKFGFPSGLHLVAAWFDRAWFRGQVVIVPIFSDQVAHLFSADCRYRYTLVFASHFLIIQSPIESPGQYGADFPKLTLGFLRSFSPPPPWSLNA